MPRTSVKIWQRSAPRRAARAIAVVSEPPRPSVVMSVPWTSSPSVRPWKPATITTLPASISRWTLAGSTLAMRALPCRESVESHREERRALVLAGREEDIELAFVGCIGDGCGKAQQLVRRVAHRGHDDDE